ncbi:hypothetical protein RN001_013140 [Aquatica leii]|uniref:Uncharacterized protein n=1 Tax=Aquatica leii TaxID=1421715 RepID=A0AAN7SNL7_9COLE|nr:hypothetical protein RN001_013140 [Aquatica leii]
MDDKRSYTDEKNKYSSLGSQSSQDEPGNAHQRIPEIKDIYDSIYGIVQSKLEFYENKQGRRSSKPNTPVKSSSYDYTTSIENNLQTKHLENDFSSLSSEPEVKDNIDNVIVDVKLSNSPVPEMPLTPPTPAVRKNLLEMVPNPDLLSNCSSQCTKCESVNFSSDRQEILTEINANLKVKVECYKQDLKKEIEKNNELNFEIANIETALEQYYKEAKYHKSTISAIYSSMKNYSTNKSEDRERYTYRRIKAISDYVETLKIKLQHQDRIIKDNFLENPYSTDLMMKYDSVRQELERLSDDNEELKNELKKRQEEEIEIIKELNRQKFKIEEKNKEVENYYKNELASKDILIANLQDKHDREIKELLDTLDDKNDEMSNIKAVYEAKISNYQEELIVVYRKLRNASKEVI